VTIQGKECDLIPAKVHGNTLTPARVSLTFGTRPCCQVAKKTDPKSPEPITPPYLMYGLVALGVVVMALTAVLVARGGPPSPPPATP
jgi:hypothetical protein